MAQQVINGKRYNTETARRVFGWSNGHYTTDFNHRSKALYRTENGNWFMHHSGGPLTDMAEWHGDSCSDGECIEPVGDKKTFEFLQAHSSDSDAAAAIEEFFGDNVADA